MPALPGYIAFLFCPVALGVYLPVGGGWRMRRVTHPRSFS